MNPYHKIREELKIQQKIEGHTPETALLLQLLTKLTKQSEWRAATTIKHHRYDPLSYETHRFYYPSALVVAILK